MLRLEDPSQIPNIIEARRLAGQVLERAEKAQIFVEETSSIQPEDEGLKKCPYQVSTDSVGSSTENQNARPQIQPFPKLRLLQSAVPVLICNGWLDDKDVTRYEMTSKSASIDANIWKSMFCQQHRAQKKTEYRSKLLLQSCNDEMSSMRIFFLGLVTVAMTSSTLLICALSISDKARGNPTTWENWLGRFGISFGIMILAEVIALQLIIRCSLGLV